MNLGDRACWWSVLPACIAVVAGFILAQPGLVSGGALALPIAIAAGLATAWGWRSTMGAALGGALVGVVLRFGGLMVGGGAVYLMLAEPLPVITVLAVCLVAGLLIDAVIRSLPVEDPVRG